MRTYKVASLFAGCGGTDIGVTGGFSFLEKSYPKHPTQLVYANDFDEGACNLFDANFDIRIDRGDIRAVNTSKIPQYDILTAGFPCQSFSVVAQNPPRLGIKDSDKGTLFEEVCRFLRDHQPSAFICENVKGILSANKGEAFPIILDSLRRCGYFVTHQVLNASNYGVPQKRERVIIVGFRDADVFSRFSWPIPVKNIRALREVLFSEKDVHDKYYFSDRAVAGMRAAKPEMNKGRAQDLDKPCGTVAAHLAKVSLNSTDPVLKINGRYRRFMPREVARIQSFPDTYMLEGPESRQYKALGNAIPPVLSWYVTGSVLHALDGMSSTCNQVYAADSHQALDVWSEHNKFNTLSYEQLLLALERYRKNIRIKRTIRARYV